MTVIVKVYVYPRERGFDERQWPQFVGPFDLARGWVNKRMRDFDEGHYDFDFVSAQTGRLMSYTFDDMGFLR